LEVRQKLLSLKYRYWKLSEFSNLYYYFKESDIMEEQMTSAVPLLSTIIYIAFIAGIMYLMVYRPQKKREKREREMRESLKVGDKIVTIGGICGKIINIKDDEITIETSV